MLFYLLGLIYGLDLLIVFLGIFWTFLYFVVLSECVDQLEYKSHFLSHLLIFTPNYCYNSLCRSRVCYLWLYFVSSHLLERSVVLVDIDDHQWMIIKFGCIVPLCIDLTIVRSRVWGVLFGLG
ncbi:hypothetical protein Hanom_Chr06g00485871 [Helianthus anomalus]